MSEKHAILSASSSHKWLICTPSARLEEKFENVTSEYMAEGTMAHAIAELKLRAYFSNMSKKDFNTNLKKLKANKDYQDEMDSYTGIYLDFVKEIALGLPNKPYVAIEQRVDFSGYVPERIWNRRLYFNTRRYLIHN